MRKKAGLDISDTLVVGSADGLARGGFDHGRRDFGPNILVVPSVVAPPPLLYTPPTLRIALVLYGNAEWLALGSVVY
jgi:hypothetical protein